MAPSGAGHGGSFNPVKAAVGAVNATRGAAGLASGVTLLVSGAVLTPFGPVSAPVGAVGAAKVASGLANLNRGAQQMSEAVHDPSGPSTKNLLGLLPFGQKFDDPAEPGPGEYVGQKFDRFVADPTKAVGDAVKDFFAMDGD